MRYGLLSVSLSLPKNKRIEALKDVTTLPYLIKQGERGRPVSGFDVSPIIPPCGSYFS